MSDTDRMSTALSDKSDTQAQQDGVPSAIQNPPADVDDRVLLISSQRASSEPAVLSMTEEDKDTSPYQSTNPASFSLPTSSGTSHSSVHSETDETHIDWSLESVAAALLSNFGEESTDQPENVWDPVLHDLDAPLSNASFNSAAPHSADPYAAQLAEAEWFLYSGTEMLKLSEVRPNSQMLSNAIAHLRTALHLLPPGHRHYGPALIHLSLALRQQFIRSGHVESLLEAITTNREALSLYPSGHEHRGTSLHNLANCLVTKFHHLGDAEALAEAISMRREALRISPDDHEDHAMRLHSLANALCSQFEHSGQINALVEAIDLYRAALRGCPQGHSDRGLVLSTLGAALQMHTIRSGDIALLEEAIELHREAVQLCPQGHPDRGLSLHNLAIALNIRFQQLGDMKALAESAQLHREALSLRPLGHSDRATSLSSLANALLMQFQQTGEARVLAETVRLHREALQLRPLGSPGRVTSLNHLASALFTSYKQTEKTETLVEAVELYTEALRLCPVGHPGRAVALCNLANSLQVQFERMGDPELLSRAIIFHRESLELRPVGHRERSDSLNNLGGSLQNWFELTQDREALTEAINLHKQVLELHPRGHPIYTIAVHNLALAYRKLHEVYRDADLLRETIELWRESVSQQPVGHPSRHLSQHNLAMLYIRFLPESHLREGLELIQTANKEASQFSRLFLTQALRSLSALEDAVSQEYGLERLILDVYIGTISLLPRVAHFGLDIASRLRELAHSEELSRIGAARALALGEVKAAVEILEQGRATFWAQALHLRSSELDRLPLEERDALTSLLLQLEQGSYGREINDRARLEAEIEHRRQLNEQADRILQGIRSRPGFEYFLKIKPFSELAEVTARGFVVILLATKKACSAIVLHPHRQETISLPINVERLHNLRVMIEESGMRDADVSFHGDDDEAQRAVYRVVRGKVDVLEVLWRCIVHPAITSIKLSVATGRDRPRLHWCPTGDFAFLPLHAAGSKIGDDLHETTSYVASSYTPSLSALVKARRDVPSIVLSGLQGLLIAEPGMDPTSWNYLPTVRDEVQTVAGLLLSVSATVLNDVDEEIAASAVAQSMSEAHILHISSHGQQHPDPLKSQFILRGGSLTIAQLMKLNLKNATLAFLSACETAKGSEEQPDQVVHLAASMLFCGFRSVVGTMWRMTDADGPLIAQWFYEELLTKEILELDDIPYALDMAVRKLRDCRPGISPARWAPYVHIGA
ncbi:hypothetical protein BDW22DRAFT_979978 [Trametopsis cervina]|nr:hypothetical protein BDW22DRAFT_979978 [Trametopsis cervina]